MLFYHLVNAKGGQKKVTEFAWSRNKEKYERQGWTHNGQTTGMPVTNPAKAASAPAVEKRSFMPPADLIRIHAGKEEPVGQVDPAGAVAEVEEVDQTEEVAAPSAAPIPAQTAPVKNKGGRPRKAK